MINIVICDDNEDYVDIIKKNVGRFFQKENIDIHIEVFNDGKSLIAYIKKSQVDLVFLDIMMPELTGFQVADEIAEVVNGENLIFVSSEEKMVFQSLDFRPLGFVRKSRLEEEIEHFLNIWLGNHLEDCITFTDAECERTILVKTIQYINSVKHYVYVHTESQEYKVRGKLDDFRKMLNANQFMLCSKSYVVNLSYVRNVTSTEIAMTNGVQLQISKANSSECRKIFNRYIRDMYKTNGLGGVR